MCKNNLAFGIYNPVVVVDLDGTLIHQETEKIVIYGKTGQSFFSQKAASLLLEISLIMPVVIATGRNALSTKKLIDKLPNINFAGFILENGFVVKKKLNDYVFINNSWDDIAKLFPDFIRLKGYENCIGFIVPVTFDEPYHFVKNILEKNNHKYFVYSEKSKIFIYLNPPDKTYGIKKLCVHPYIGLGNELNDFQILNACDFPVTLKSASEKIKQLVEKKKGYCSLLQSHAGTEDMLNVILTKLRFEYKL